MTEHNVYFASVCAIVLQQNKTLLNHIFVEETINKEN